MQPQTIGEYIAKHGEQPLWAMPGPNWVGQDDDGQPELARAVVARIAVEAAQCQK